jgi:hypothetical protein
VRITASHHAVVIAPTGPLPRLGLGGRNEADLSAFRDGSCDKHCSESR